MQAVKKKMKMAIAQVRPTLCDPMDGSVPGSSVHGILQQEFWNGLPFPSIGDLSNPRIEPGSPALQVDFFYHLSRQGSPHRWYKHFNKRMDGSLRGKSSIHGTNKGH